MIWRGAALAVLFWVLGFAVFMMSLGQPLEARTTDAIVVLTGGPGRIDRGIALLEEKAARRMLISGVDPDVRPGELAAEYQADRALFDCCIDLGQEAVDTRSNADEAAAWVRGHGYASVRLVTSDWHMPRAHLELAHALGNDIELLGDPVPTRPRLRTLFAEYHKYLIRRAALLIRFD
ncbi:YdcF family protein [Stakelama tenebrarum]|uniref:YdcF family protein n=1 Tax=Stakelama tenebrarum TaxID=2711215 RepID=A0A6G6Y0K4_9SPHN|nr:YdcF family protein [Sphingosinithalassobacter tenebrarum]QIG78474.1 YdcF family protein [Sphingosinithalassobacter tenebrarum]